jgi:hypothetical protein
VEGVAKETGNEALSSSLGAVSKTKVESTNFCIKMQEAMAEDVFFLDRVVLRFT